MRNGRCHFVAGEIRQILIIGVRHMAVRLEEIVGGCVRQVMMSLLGMMRFDHCGLLTVDVKVLAAVLWRVIHVELLVLLIECVRFSFVLFEVVVVVANGILKVHHDLMV